MSTDDPKNGKDRTQKVDITTLLGRYGSIAEVPENLLAQAGFVRRTGTDGVARLTSFSALKTELAKEAAKQNEKTDRIPFDTIHFEATTAFQGRTLSEVDASYFHSMEISDDVFALLREGEGAENFPEKLFGETTAAGQAFSQLTRTKPWVNAAQKPGEILIQRMMDQAQAVLSKDFHSKIYERYNRFAREDGPGQDTHFSAQETEGLALVLDRVRAKI
jgi:hypothetical protein